MVKMHLLSVIGAAVAMSRLMSPGDLQAEERKLGYALTVGAASDYMFRGISYSDQDPIANAYLEVNYGIVYASMYTTRIDYAAYGPWEQDFFLGIRPVTGPINWDLSANWYIYGNRDKGEFGSSFDIDYVEFKIGATTALTRNLTAGASVWLAPDQGYATTSNVSAEGTLAYKLPQWQQFAPTLSGLIGYSDSGTNQYYPTGYWVGQQSYTYWNAGLRVDVEKFFMDFRYWDTSIDDDLTDARFVFSTGVNLLP